MSHDAQTETLPTPDPLIGKRLGEYEVLAPIGEGGMGVVYRGVQPVIKKRVAIKVLKPSAGRDAANVRRLTDEAEAVNSIRHRNIIDIFSLGQLPDGRPYIVMEFLEGQPLDSFVRHRGRLPLSEAMGLLIAICSPLGAAHRANVIHRDLKPSNIFVCVGADGERYLKLLDFGIAKKAASLHGTTEQTSRAAIIGTPNYMAPEQGRGDQISARTDLYALGVMAYELVTGTLPYSAPGPFEVVMQHFSAPIPSARVLAPAVPPALDALIQKMMAKEAADRVQSAEEVRAALIEIARSEGLRASFEASDPVTGELARADLATQPGLTSKSQAELATSETLMSMPSVQVMRRRIFAVALAGVAGVLAVGTWALLARPKPAVIIVSPPLAAPLQPLPAVPPPPTAVVAPPEVTPTAKPDVAPAPPVDPTHGARPDTSPPGPRPRHEVPSAEALRARVAKLETALARSVPAGEDPDPSAVTLLRKYKVEATMADSPEDRARLARTLDGFERSFLKR